MLKYIRMKNIYEIGFLINPDFSQQEAEGKVSDIKKILEKNSASVLSEGEVVDIDLAYQIVTKIGPDNVRFNKAYFTWVKFETESSTIEDIKKDVDLAKTDYFRYMVTKTIADDSLTDVYKKISEEEVDLEKEVNELESSDKENETEEAEKNDEVKKDEEKKADSTNLDDLTKIEGIGPKIASVFAENGIATFEELSKADTDELKEILVKNSLGRHNPLSWPKQAELAFAGKWDKLKELQDELMGGI